MVEEPYPQRKQIRLDPRRYADITAICSITVCVLDRAPIFRDNSFTRACIDLLATLANHTGVAVHAYCFMPDHLHTLITPAERTSAIEFVGRFKSLSTRLAWHHGLRGKIWQPRFYDHFLRRDQALPSAVNYILNNPVRKGLAPTPSEYPFSGSLAYDLGTAGNP